MLGVTKFMQNERFIQCPLSLIWSVIFVQDSRSTLQYSLEIVSFLYSWHVMEDIWVQLSVQRWEAWPGLPCLAWRATILRYLSLDAPGHVIFLPGRWIECRAQLQIMKPVFGSSCDSAWSAGAPIALASLTQIHTHGPFQKSCWLWRSRAESSLHWLVVSLKILENVWRTWVENGGFWV